jgi:hypothetical protein
VITTGSDPSALSRLVTPECTLNDAHSGPLLDSFLTGSGEGPKRSCREGPKRGLRIRAQEPNYGLSTDPGMTPLGTVLRVILVHSGEGPLKRVSWNKVIGSPDHSLKRGHLGVFRGRCGDPRAHPDPPILGVSLRCPYARTRVHTPCKRSSGRASSKVG